MHLINGLTCFIIIRFYCLLTNIFLPSQYILRFIVIIIAVSSFTGQGEIISNLLDTIQQLYYLKYMNQRIGVNLQIYFQTFKIIQLTNIFDLFGINPDGQMSNILSFYNSEPTFEMDDRNANYLNNIVQLIQVYFLFTIAYFSLKILSSYLLRKIHTLTGYCTKQIQFTLIRAAQQFCFRIQKLNIIQAVQSLFLTMIYEFSINTVLALNYQKSDTEGQLGFSLAITILYLVLLLLISNTHFEIPLNKIMMQSQKQSNSFNYLCIQKMFFIISIGFFFENPQIQVFLCLLNEVQLIYFIYKKKVQMVHSESRKL